MAKIGSVPAGHKLIGSAVIGDAFGHTPGHFYRDIDVAVSQRGGKVFRVGILKVWGSAQGQGCEEEHGRVQVAARGDSIQEAAEAAAASAKAAGITERDYLTEAISQATDEAEETMAILAEAEETV